MVEKPLPTSDWCYVCGVENPLGHQVVFTTDGERVRARYTPQAHRQGYRGVVHGGVLCTLLDETMGWAPSLHRDRLYVTAELSVRFVKPARVEEELVVEARTSKVTSRLALVTGEVRDSAGELCARAEGKFLPMSQEETRQVDRQLRYTADTVQLFRNDAS